jgi:signal transduction histidine kinase
MAWLKGKELLVINALVQHNRQDTTLSTPILIVDDEPSGLEGLKEFLEDEGYQVHLASDGQEALKLFHEFTPELVVTDLRMPGMSGIDVIRRIKKLNRNTAVIVITAYGSLDSAVDAIRLNVFDFLQKPIELDQLKETLERARENQRMSRKRQEQVEYQREQLANAQKRLDEYQEKMTEVESLALAGQQLAGLLHNLVGPLSYIMGQAQVLRMLYPGLEKIEKIEKQALRMEQFIATVLAKFKHSKARHRELLQFNDILKEEMLFLEAHPFVKNEIRTHWHLAPELPLFEGTAADFAQVLGNLLRNAAESMQKQPDRQLTLTTRHDDFEIQIAIQDTGVGVPDKLHETIFQPFFSTKMNEAGIAGGFGTGLGLYSCQQVLEQYGGYIKVSSQPGQGSTFTVHLPKTPRNTC